MQTHHQDGDGRRGIQIDGDRALAAQGFHQNVVDDLDDLLAGGDGGQYLRPDRAFPHFQDEIAHHGQRDVGIQQREANLPQGFAHIGFAQRATAAQLVEHPRKLV